MEDRLPKWVVTGDNIYARNLKNYLKNFRDVKVFL
jgi:hypothetical protein